MMWHFKSLAFFLIVVTAVLSVWIGANLKQYNTLIKQCNTYLIQLDSLKAENNKTTSQLKYLLKFFDSTKKRIPEPTGFAFIADSVTKEGN